MPSLDQADNAALTKLLSETGDLGVDRGIDLTRHRLGGRPDHEAEEGHDGGAEQQDVDQREMEDP